MVLIGGLGFGRAEPPSSQPNAVTQKPKTQETTPLAATLSASGTVVDAHGKPIAGATVILREWSTYRTRGMKSEDYEQLRKSEGVHDTLAETKTDADGRFHFEGSSRPGLPEVPEAGKSVFPWDVVALASGHGLAWVQLTPQQQQHGHHADPGRGREHFRDDWSSLAGNRSRGQRSRSSALIRWGRILEMAC